MNIVARETSYKGQLFRSRLEARWAAFFDVAGWRWEYEPLDLNGWVPDFVLIGTRKNIFVEVKPICWIGDGNDIISTIKSRHDLQKVREWRDCGGEVDECVVLGAYPHIEFDKYADDIYLGGLLCISRSNIFGGIECINCGFDYDCAIMASGYGPFLYDFFGRYGWYGYRIGGQYDGDGHIKYASSNEVLLAWNYCGKATRWSRR